ncbi:MAG: hypothetical protein OK456_02230 [Thaumarchaeota archaeon]|nr:hypothetical protein [Nitrososphaerota archaeon]
MSEQDRPCEYHKTAPCGNRGEPVDFPDGVHYICDQGMKQWNETHNHKIFRKGFLSAAGGKSGSP